LNGVTWISATPSYSVGAGDLVLRHPMNPTLEWATGFLSEVYDGIFRYMEESYKMARQAVQSLSRVDTGLMRQMADATFHVRGDVFELNFGWWEDAPYYAVFQEFGTIHIDAMLAVGQVFEEIWTGLRSAAVPG
jgi:hypothetical protein